MNSKRKMMETEAKFCETKSKVSKISDAKKKALNKNELIVQYKALEKSYEELFKENENNMQRIKVLEMQLTPTVSKSQECQTKNETEYVEISCTECIFLASCEDELNYHMGEEHDKDFISYFESEFPCSVCDRWCRTEK